MKITMVSSGPTGTRLNYEGQITQHELVRNREVLKRLLEETPYRDRLLVNMERVTFLDTAGISWMVSEHKRCQQLGGVVVYCCVPPSIRSMLELVGVDRVLNLAGDVAQAERFLRDGKPKG